MGDNIGIEIKDAKNLPDSNDSNDRKGFKITGNIFQSEGELKTQKQNRMRNIIRSRIEKERNQNVETNNMDQLDEEMYEAENREISETEETYEPRTSETMSQ